MPETDDIYSTAEYEVFPSWLRLILNGFVGLVAIFCFMLIMKSLINESELPKDIVSLFIYSVVFLSVINIPWASYFSKIKKIGPVEFQNE